VVVIIGILALVVVIVYNGYTDEVKILLLKKFILKQQNIFQQISMELRNYTIKSLDFSTLELSVKINVAIKNKDII
jgi:Tfp pilus assembly protein PilE